MWIREGRFISTLNLTNIETSQLLGLAKQYLLRGETAAAQSICEVLLSSNTALYEAWHVSGLAMASRGELAGAIPRLRRAARSSDASTLFIRDLAVALLAAKLWKPSVRAFERCLAQEPDHAGNLALYSRALFELDRKSEAQDACLQALGCEPKDTKILLNIARTLGRLRVDADALRCVNLALQVDPVSADAHRMSIHIHRAGRRYDDVLRSATRAVRLRPADKELRVQYGIALFDTGRTDAALKQLTRATDAEHHRPETGSTVINVLLHQEGHTGNRLLAESRTWETRHCAGIRVRRTYDNDPDPNRVLRVGYLTGEFATVPSYYFLYPLLAAHNRSSVEVSCFHSRPESDDFTANLRRASDEWHDVSSQSDSDVAREIRRSRIDILVDCSGHYPYNRLLAFAKKPAPVQVAYPNYPGTTGLSAFDAILTDKWTTPEGTEQEYAEPVWRLPSGYLTYTPPECAPPANTSAREDMRFGVFQRPGKLTAAFWDAAADVLLRTPRSRLLVHYLSADLHDRHSRSSRNVIAQLVRRGVAAERIDLCGALPMNERLELLSQVDIALDTFPYNGQTTTCECLWMGVPVITMYGHSHVGRVGGGLLRRIGLGSFVAESPRDYVDIAAGLSQDRIRREELRSSLRAHLLTSTLMRPGVVTADVEAAYRALWRRWCSKRQGQSKTRQVLTGA